MREMDNRLGKNLAQMLKGGVIMDVVNTDEVAEGKFVSFEKLNELIKNNQIKFSPWGIDELNYLFNNLQALELFHRLSCRELFGHHL